MAQFAPLAEKSSLNHGLQDRAKRPGRGMALNGQSAGGLSRRAWILLLCLSHFLAALAVTGTPPFAIFAGEILIFSALIGQYGWWPAAVVMVFLVIAFIAVNFRIGKMIFTGNEQQQKQRQPIETLVPIINLSLSLISLLFIPYIEHLLQKLLLP